MLSLSHFIYRGTPVTVPLDSRAGTLRCAVRQTWVRATPEEYIRQEVLYGLHQCQISYPITIRVESLGNLDIVITVEPPNRDFWPFLPPVLIIETKQEEVSLNDTAECQILGYMKRERCDVGILTNGREIIRYQLNPYQRRPLHDFGAVEACIEERVTTLLAPIRQQQTLFAQARAGCFASFKDLMADYGQDSRTLTQLALWESQDLWTGSRFTCEADAVVFRPDGAIRTTKRFLRTAFQRLVRIKPA